LRCGSRRYTVVLLIGRPMGTLSDSLPKSRMWVTSK
jgi:hypothetical protein